MNEEQIKKIIDERFENLIKSDRYTFHKLIQMLDGRNLQLGRSVGTKIGTASDQKIGLYGTSPTAQQSKISDPSGGVTTDAEARTAINAIIDALETLGITAAS